jgi:ribosomal protein S4
MSWSKYNVYNLHRRTKPEDISRRTVFQQKWIAKRELRAYHVPNITETQLLNRHWKNQLPLQQLTAKEKERLPPVQALAFGELERRLDVALFRAHFASSIWQARASVVQGHVKVNGEKVRIFWK